MSYTMGITHPVSLTHPGKLNISAFGAVYTCRNTTSSRIIDTLGKDGLKRLSFDLILKVNLTFD